jgi:hypothetical protein
MLHHPVMPCRPCSAAAGSPARCAGLVPGVRALRSRARTLDTVHAAQRLSGPGRTAGITGRGGCRGPPPPEPKGHTAPLPPACRPLPAVPRPAVPLLRWRPPAGAQHCLSACRLHGLWLLSQHSRGPCSMHNPAALAACIRTLRCPLASPCPSLQHNKDTGDNVGPLVSLVPGCRQPLHHVEAGAGTSARSRHPPAHRLHCTEGAFAAH